MFRIGIDVGGTNTDAVIMRGREILAAHKAPTSGDATRGVVAAIQAVLAQSGLQSHEIGAVIIGTTWFTNAVVARRDLAQTAIVRLCLPATQCLPPMVDWPEDLAAAIGTHHYLAHGGYEFDGRVISPLDPHEIAAIGRDIAAKGIRSIAICAVFAPVNAEMEEIAAGLLAETVPGAAITVSGPIGRLGLLERESAAILNSALAPLAARTVDGLAAAVAACGLDCPFYLSQNDGTLMDAADVRRFPVLTFASGPTNSMRGAAFLSGHKEALVADVGGTTTDVGLLQHGFPRQATSSVDVGGVLTNFQMPDLCSIGLGGGSIVRPGTPTVGPDSVGYRIGAEALIFGGNTVTATDIAVASGRVVLGEVGRVAHLDPTFVAAALREIDSKAEAAIERARVTAARLPVIAVGGGAILLPDRIGELEVVRPPHFGVANAIGAAIAQVSGQTDKVVSLAGTSREAALAEAEAEARARAARRGGIAETMVVTEREDVPLAYLPGNATRIRVKVVADMRF